MSTHRVRQSFRPHAACLQQAFAMLWPVTRQWTRMWLVLLAIQGILPAAMVALTRLVVDALVNTSQARQQKTEHVLELIVLMGGLLLLQEVVRLTAEWIRVAQAELVQDHIVGLIHQKSQTVDLSFYDSSKYYDHLHRARQEAWQRPAALLESAGSLMQNGLTVVALGVMLLSYGPWLPLLLLLSSLPLLFVVLRFSDKQHGWRTKIASDERRSWYYDWLLTAGENAAEMRIFGLHRYFGPAFQTLRKRLRGERLALAKEQGLAEFAARTGGLCVAALALGWMGYRVLQGAATLGDLALFYQAFNQGQRLMQSLLDNLRSIYSNTLFLNNLFEFLSLPSQIVSKTDALPFPPRLQQGIRFRNVTFRYPDAERCALRDFNLWVPAQSMVAIVGENGAGKSTLLKLLCRFYDPDAGSIEIDGIDLRRLDVSELRQAVSALMQAPIRYSETAHQNIAFGDYSRSYSHREVQQAAHWAGADTPIEKLPAGYETPLGKWFEGGAELSVGEWQRVALARALFRPADLLLLDEPTSAMDPWTEAQWLQRLRAATQDRTVVMITHRFTAAMRADLICVVQDGHVVEIGSHLELLEAGGFYAQSWHSLTSAQEQGCPA